MVTEYSRTIDPQKPNPTPIIQDFVNNKSVSKLHGLKDALAESSWKNVGGPLLSELINRLKSLNSQKRKADYETSQELVAQQVTDLVNLILFNMTSTQALNAFNSMDQDMDGDMDDRLKFLNLLPMQTRLWIIQSTFNQLDEKQQDAIIPLLTKWIEAKKMDIFLEEEVQPAEEPNGVQSLATWALKLSEMNPKLSFIKEIVINQISCVPAYEFPLEALGKHLAQVTDQSYRELVISEVEKNVLIKDLETRLNTKRSKLNEFPALLHYELAFLALHLSELNQIDTKFKSYIHECIKTVKESVFDRINNDLAVDLIPIFLQFDRLEEAGEQSNQLKVSFWHSAPADCINPLLQKCLEQRSEGLDFLINLI